MSMIYGKRLVNRTITQWPGHVAGVTVDRVLMFRPKARG